MIVKILKSSANFEGINYNERKTDKGDSELLRANNFQGMLTVGGPKKSDYKRYMEAVGALNSEVSQKQFHAVISTKGNQHSHEELLAYAESYLQEMGYGNNPYLIYAHSDTGNNHVHMVSTRIDKNGKKIKDSFEKIRSQEVMQNILKEDPKVQAESDLKNCFEYNVSSKSQLFLLLENLGYRIKDDKNKFQLIKFGKVLNTFESDSVLETVNRYNANESRRKQLTAIFNKYRVGRSTESFKSILQSKFGIDLILHYGKGHTVPYGYSVIDHSQKEVFKGSEILKIKLLLDNLDPNQVLSKGKEYISNVNQTVSFTSLKSDLKKEFNLTLTKRGEVYYNQTDNGFILDSETLNLLRYSTRLESAKSYAVHNEREKAILSKLYGIKANDLVVSSKPIDTLQYELTLDSINRAKNGNDLLKNEQMRLVSYQNQSFLIDDKQKLVTTLDNNYSNLSQIYLSNDFEKQIKDKYHFRGDTLLLNLIDVLGSTDFSSDEKERMKKRKGNNKI